jgi:hypothetical protein
MKNTLIELVRLWHPCRDAETLGGGDRGCRFAQSPANDFDPSGIRAPWLSRIRASWLRRWKMLLRFPGFHGTNFARNMPYLTSVQRVEIFITHTSPHWRHAFDHWLTLKDPQVNRLQNRTEDLHQTPALRNHNPTRPKVPKGSLPLSAKRSHNRSRRDHSH